MTNSSDSQYQLTITNTGKKEFKNLPKGIRQQLLEKIQILKTDPLKGEPLKGRFNSLRSFHASIGGVAYRAVCKIVAETMEVEIQLIGTRENFYRKLEEMRV